MITDPRSSLTETKSSRKESGRDAPALVPQEHQIRTRSKRTGQGIVCARFVHIREEILKKENGQIQTAENNSRQVKGKLGKVLGTNSVAVWHKLTLNLSIDCKITRTITVNN